MSKIEAKFGEVIRFWQNQNLASPSTSDLLRLQFGTYLVVGTCSFICL